MNLDSLLTKLASSYSESAAAEVVKQIAATGKKPAAPKGEKRPMRKLRDSEPCEIQPATSAVPTIASDPPGTLNGFEFRDATIGAGMRLSEPDADGRQIRYCDPREVRNDKIRAIAAYVGFQPLPARRYDEKGKTPLQNERSFAEQEMLASMQAERETNARPIGATPPRRIPLSVAGYVHGMPNDLRRKVLDLKGREQLAADTEAEHVKLAKDATDDATRSEHEGLALLERERRAQIQADLRALGAL